MWSYMLGGLREVVISFKFRQNRLNGFRDVEVEICHFLYLRPVANITACTTVQAVMNVCNDAVDTAVSSIDVEVVTDFGSLALYIKCTKICSKINKVIIIH